MYLANIWSQDKLHVSSAYPKHKNPKSIQEMGLYNSTMAISTGFTVWLKCKGIIFQYQTSYLNVNQQI
jgi:hypothetical protein